MTGFAVEYHGSLALVRPLSADVEQWLGEMTGEEALWFGGALVVEPRYLDDLVAELLADGFELVAVS